MDNDFLPQLDEIPAQLLWSAFKLWQQHRSAGLKELGLTHAQFITLAALLWLVKRNKHVTQVMLAGRSKVDIMHTSRIIRSLEKKELVTRAPSAEDSRANYVQITPKGEKVVIKGLASVEKIGQTFFKPIRNREKEFIDLMKTLIQANDIPNDIPMERNKRL